MSRYYEIKLSYIHYNYISLETTTVCAAMCGACNSRANIAVWNTTILWHSTVRIMKIYILYS